MDSLGPITPDRERIRLRLRPDDGSRWIGVPRYGRVREALELRSKSVRFRPRPGRSWGDLVTAVVVRKDDRWRVSSWIDAPLEASLRQSGDPSQPSQARVTAGHTRAGVAQDGSFFIDYATVAAIGRLIEE